MQNTEIVEPVRIAVSVSYHSSRVYRLCLSSRIISSSNSMKKILAAGGWSVSLKGEELPLGRVGHTCSSIMYSEREAVLVLMSL